MKLHWRQNIWGKIIILIILTIFIFFLYFLPFPLYVTSHLSLSPLHPSTSLPPPPSLPSHLSLSLPSIPQSSLSISFGFSHFSLTVITEAWLIPTRSTVTWRPWRDTTTCLVSWLMRSTASRPSARVVEVSFPRYLRVTSFPMILIRNLEGGTSPAKTLR